MALSLPTLLIPPWIKFLGVAALCVGSFSLAWHMQEKNLELQQAAQEKVSREAREAWVTKVSKAEADFRKKEIDLNEQLTKAKADHARLARSYDSGDRRMFLKATCPAASGNSSSSSGVDSGEKAELAPEVRRAILDFRRELIENEIQSQGRLEYIESLELLQPLSP